jgi:hypothetical protein
MIKEKPEGFNYSRGSAISGVQGTYPLYVEAYRAAAKDLGLKPREVQSIAWEVKQRLFSFRQTGKRTTSAVDAIWRDYHDGKLSIDEARKKIVDESTELRGGAINWGEPSMQADRAEAA